MLGLPLHAITYILLLLFRIFKSHCAAWWIYRFFFVLARCFQLYLGELAIGSVWRGKNNCIRMISRARMCVSCVWARVRKYRTWYPTILALSSLIIICIQLNTAYSCVQWMKKRRRKNTHNTKHKIELNYTHFMIAHTKCGTTVVQSFSQSVGRSVVRWAQIGRLDRYNLVLIIISMRVCELRVIVCAMCIQSAPKRKSRVHNDDDDDD